MRLFTGISIPLHIREEIEGYIREIRDPLKGVKWVELDNFHITLKFLGEVDQERIPPLLDGLKASAAGVSPISISLSSISAFPSIKYPRVYWIGVDKGKEMVRTLHDNVERELEMVGFSREGKSFHPHVTIGRVKKMGRINDKVAFEVRHFGEFVAHDFCLYKSTITKGGPIYDIIDKVDLGEK